MKRATTFIWLACLFGLWHTTLAQTRSDVIWARFLNGEQITIDGVMDEAVWDKAETYDIVYGQYGGAPGSGWFIQSIANSELAGPTDPPQGTIKMLANGDSLYIAGTIKDASIGGSRGLWDLDALFLPIRNVSAFGPSGDGFHWFNTQIIEMMYGWWNSLDTTATGLPLPGIGPYPHTSFEPFGWRQDRTDETGSRPERTADQLRNWEVASVIDGTTNDDSGDPDQGWTFEMKLNMAELGYHLDAAGGETVEMGTAVHDGDWWWPTNQETAITSRAWFQAQWANSFRRGSIKVKTDPSVNVDTETLPSVDPDYIIPNAGELDAPTIDGVLNESVWQKAPVVLQTQYGNQDLIESLPSPGKYGSGYFRPGASPDVDVVDPSLASLRWFFKGDMLYVGVDVDDQAVDSTRGEGGDGFRFAINDRGDLDPNTNDMVVREFIVTVDENGEARLEGYFPTLIEDGMEGAFDAALSLKGSTTVADPSDVDQGYQIEMAFDLSQVLNYPAGRGDGMAFASVDLFDSDKFEDDSQNYRTVAWRFRERSDGAPATAFMDPNEVLPGGHPMASEGRDDVLWARFAEGAPITIDGMANEAAWDNAETINIAYGEYGGVPGSGWFIQSIANSELAGPTDPPQGTIKMLAEGDSLYIAGNITDASIGGSRGLWDLDALFLPIRNVSAFGPSGDGFHWFNTQIIEMMYGWWNSLDTTATGLPLPGIGPYPHTSFEPFGWRQDRTDETGARPDRTADQLRNWEVASVVNGTTNDDSGDPDQGWSFEMKLNMAELGYNLNDPAGETVEMGTAVHDGDWWWPTNQETAITSRAWFQAQWANSFRRGSIKVKTDPSVTISSGAPPVVQPDYVIPNADGLDAPVIDGVLDEDVWAASETAIQTQYGNQDLVEALPSPGKYGSGYFRPGASPDVDVVDPSLASLKWFFKGDMLYVGVDVDDQAIDSTRGEGGDGFRFAINDRGNLDPNTNDMVVREFIVTVDENGEARLEGYFPTLIENGMEDAFDAALSLKGSSTVADPSDVDEGYQIEMAFDLTKALNYPAGRGDGVAFASVDLFDSDKFEDDSQNYRTVAWRFRERSDGAPAWAYMDPAVSVAVEDDVAEVPDRLRLDGNYPNPFNPSTTVRYELPTTGQVQIEIFDVLGRRVALLKPGTQTAGIQQVTFDASRLASGIYFYRVDFTRANANVKDVQHVTGKMVLVK